MSKIHLALTGFAAACAGLLFLLPGAEPGAPGVATRAESVEAAPRTQRAAGALGVRPASARAAGSARTTTARSAAVTGLVLGPDRAPIGGATVCYGDAAQAVTDPRGRFELFAGEQQPLLEVTADGMATAALPGVAPGGQVVVQLELQATVRGRLLCERTGLPVQGGWVEVKAGAVTRAVEAGADGAFVVDKVPPGRALLVAGGDRHELTRRAGCFLTATSDALTLRLAPAAAVRGRVVSQADGLGVAGVEVVHRSGGSDRDRIHTATTDGAGRFDFGPLATADAELHVRAEGHAHLARRLLPADQGRPLELLVAPCVSGSKIRVVQAGRPVRGAVVRCRQGERELQLTTDRHGIAEAALDLLAPVQLSCRTERAAAFLTWLPRNAAEARLELQAFASIEVVADGERHLGQPVLVESRDGIRSGVLDDAGVCRFDQLPAGATTVLLGEHRLTVGQALLRAGEHRSIQLDQQGLTEVALRVTDEFGAPLAGARWSLRQRGSARVGSAQGFTDTDGGAQVLAAGYAELHVALDGYAAAKIDLDPARDQGALRAVTMSALQRVSGHVVDAATQTPIERFTVICLPQGTEHAFWSPTGAFELEAPGATEVRVRATGWQTCAPLPLAGGPIRAELGGQGGVYGRVLGPNGAGLANVQVRLRTAGVASPPAVLTDADGAFRFSDVAPSGYRLLAESCGQVLATADVVVHDRDARVEQPLQVAKLQGLHVLAYDGDAGPASATAISVECPTPGGVRRRTASADVDGYAHLDGLLPGLYTVRAKTRGRTAVQVVMVGLDEEEPLVELALR